MNIIGISAYYHDAACCLLQDGQLVAAAAEERFSRIKHDRRLPVRAFRFILQAGRIGINDVDCIAYYEMPIKKLARQLWSGNPTQVDPFRPEREIREKLGYEGKIEFFEHHQSHAASAFFYSGFDDAAILTVDGVGEWTTTSYGAGHDSTIELFEEVEFPTSLGLLYSSITSYLGFEVNDGEYKVMGLAPYGEPRYLNKIHKLLRSGEEGQYSLDLKYFDFVRGGGMYSEALCKLFGAQPRRAESELTQFHKDIARSLQVALEEILLEKTRYLYSQVGSPNLCMAGGVALNCVANSRILREGPFRKLFVQPAAGDDGGCLGAAALAHIHLNGKRHTRNPLEHVYLGPKFNNDEIAELLSVVGLEALNFRGRETELVLAVVDLLLQGKVIGWFQGAMEFGPRALGARSILADPRDPKMRKRINRLVKKREEFRPFAPSVLRENAAEFFELHHASPFMMETAKVIDSAFPLPSVTHVDRSARIQTVDSVYSPRFAALLRAFYRRTECPVLLNTSFNLRGEPIVCSPPDALRCMAKAQLDALILEDFLIQKEMISDALMEAIEFSQTDAFPEMVSKTVYTFV